MMENDAKLGLIGGILAAIGAFMPWVYVSASVAILGTFSVSASGIQGDGVLTLVLGIIAIVFAFIAKTGALKKFGLLAVGALTTIISIYELANIQSHLGALGGGITTQYGSASAGAGMGLYLTLIAGIIIMIGGYMAFKKK